MCDRNTSTLVVFMAIVLAASLIAAGAFAQTQPGAVSTPAPAPAASPSPPSIHYHFHQHNYSPTAPNAMWPTAAQPYPPGSISGGFAPIGFQNTAPGALPAQGVIHVFLPTSDAVVYINGQQLLAKKGKDRKFTTPALPSNREFQYWVTATFAQNGESVTQYRKAIVGTGEYTVVDFTRPPEENPIRLPAGPVDPNSVFPPTPE
jgi:uncharacterized protein (TIGR03000 family)